MSNPLSSFGYSDNDYASAVATAMAESGTRPNRNEMAGIVDVLANRREDNPYGFGARAPTIASVAQGYFGNRTQFDPWSGIVPGTRARGSVPARETLRDGLRAALNDRFARTLDENSRAKLGLAKEAVMAVLGSGVQRGISKGAVNFTGTAVPLTTARATEHDRMGRQNATQIGATSFYGPDHNPNTPFSLSGRVAEQFAHDVGYPAMPGAMFGIDDQAFPSGQVQYGGPLADLTPSYPDISTGSYYGGNVPPDWGRAEIGGIPDRSTGSFYGNTPQQIGGAPPDWGMNQNEFGNRDPLGSFSFSGMQTSSMEPNMAVYDGGPYGYGMSPPGDMFSGQPIGAPQGFANWGDGEVGYPSNGFSGQPSQPAAPSPASLGIGTVGMQGPASFSYDPSLVSQSMMGGYSVPGQFGQFGAMPETPQVAYDDPMIPQGDIEEAPQTQRGITGYTNTTTQVPNPAYDAWAQSYGNKPNAMQNAWLGAMEDKIGVQRGPFTSMPPNAVPKAPSKTLSQNVRSPVYGQVPVHGLKSSIPSFAARPTVDPVYGSPVGGSWGGPDGWGGFGSSFNSTLGVGTPGMANVLSSGLQGFGGTFGTGLSFQGQPVNSPFGGFFNGLGDAFGLGGWGSGAANVGSGWGNSGSQGGIGGAGGFSGGDAGYGSDARSGRDGADQGNN